MSGMQVVKLRDLPPGQYYEVWAGPYRDHTGYRCPHQGVDCDSEYVWRQHQDQVYAATQIDTAQAEYDRLGLTVKTGMV